ncbi:regulatory protein RecX [Helicovermis profundi]|uniref:Regulatory protein RecX n=1 Tax=Helicovermis profundi TaxID=3065157 RepID=A0AAU9E584_9FIRM|nr:hypothetical protein HLPR_21820 [Clostridia bacterium S502]
MRENEVKKGFNYALNVLSYRDRTEKEIRDKMTTKEYEKSVIDEVLLKLKKLNLINDVEFTEKYVEFRIERYGKNRLKQELFRKGISKEIIENVLSYVGEDEEFLAAKEIAIKKFNQYGDIPFEKKYNRLMGLLSRKGYSYSTVKRVFEELGIKRSNYYE